MSQISKALKKVQELRQDHQEQKTRRYRLSYGCPKVLAKERALMALLLVIVQ